MKVNTSMIWFIIHKITKYFIPDHKFNQITALITCHPAEKWSCIAMFCNARTRTLSPFIHNHLMMTLYCNVRTTHVK